MYIGLTWGWGAQLSTTSLLRSILAQFHILTHLRHPCTETLTYGRTTGSTCIN